MEKLIKQAEKANVKVVFGLEAQGHIPTIQAEIKRWNDSFKEHYPDSENVDMSYEKHVWEKIGKIIGWCPFTASLSYFEWIHKNSSTGNKS